MTDYPCSMVAAAHATATSPTTLRTVLAQIQQGTWADQVSQVRRAYFLGGKDAANEPKRRLPGVLFSGTFSQRNAASLQQHSGLICVDLDGLNGTTAAIKEQIAADPHTLAAFVSPTGSGLKAVFRVDPALPHAQSFHAAESYLLTKFGLQIDQACKDVSRLCFISHDPEAFIADDATLLPYPAPPSTAYHPPVLNLDLRPGDDYDSRHDLPSLLAKHGWTKYPGGFTRPGKASGLSATFDHVPGRFHVFTSSAPPFTPNHNYKPWHVYALLEHAGDFSAAAKALAQQGYGPPRQPPTPSRQQQNLDRMAGPVPDTLPARPLDTFLLPPATDPSILIGNRWLSKGDIFILASTSGMGKSSLTIQAAVTWSLGLPLFGGFRPSRPLRSLIIQSEDGDGDIAEVRLSLEHAMRLTPEQRAQASQNVRIVTDRIHRGASFRAELAAQVASWPPDIIWINPLLAFLGGDVNDSTDVGTFLREQLNSLNSPAQFAYGIVHHTAKPPKEKAQRQWNEVMYEMAGSADLTNAARAVIALQATQTPGEFNLILAKRGIRAGLTRPVAQGAGFRQEPVTTISVHHSKERMDVCGVSMPVIHWERGEDQVEESPEQKGGRKASTTIAKFGDKIPQSQDKAQPIPMIHRAVKDMTELTYNGFKKLILRAYDNGVMKMVEKPGLGACFYRPPEG